MTASRNHRFWLVGVLLTVCASSCGDIQTAFVIREDGSAVIRYTYIARYELKETSEKYIAARTSIDSVLQIWIASGAIQSFAFSPVINSALQLEIQVRHFQKIDSIHRLIYQTTNLHNTSARLTGFEPGMRDSIVFETSGDSIQCSILNWVPTHIDTAQFVKTVAELDTLSQKLDSLRLLNGGRDSLRAVKRIAERLKRNTQDYYSETARELAKLYSLPSRRYSFNAPFLLRHELPWKVSSIVIDREFSETRWWNMNMDREDITAALGFIPSQWFKLTAPPLMDRAQWKRFFNWCDECEEGFNVSGQSGSGIRTFTNSIGTTTFLIDCGSDKRGKRTLLAWKGYSDSLDNFADSRIHTVLTARPKSDSVDAWISDMFVGDVELDTVRGMITVTHLAGERGVRLIKTLQALEPESIDVETLTRGKWSNKGKVKERFSFDETEDCSSPD